MIDASFRAAPGQNAVAQNELDSFRLAIDATIQSVEHLENLHCRASGPFTLCPFIAQSFPALEGCELRGIVLKAPPLTEIIGPFGIAPEQDLIEGSSHPAFSHPAISEDGTGGCVSVGR